MCCWAVLFVIRPRWGDPYFLGGYKARVAQILCDKYQCPILQTTHQVRFEYPPESSTDLLGRARSRNKPSEVAKNNERAATIFQNGLSVAACVACAVRISSNPQGFSLTAADEGCALLCLDRRTPPAHQCAIQVSQLLLRIRQVLHVDRADNGY